MKKQGNAESSHEKTNKMVRASVFLALGLILPFATGLSRCCSADWSAEAVTDFWSVSSVRCSGLFFSECLPYFPMLSPWHLNWEPTDLFPDFCTAAPGGSVWQLWKSV